MATIDYNLHGLAGIRLLNATPADIAIVNRQLGPIQAPLTREPDITIRFVDELPTTQSIRYLGVDDVGFTDDAFLVLRSKHKSRAKVQIPFAQIGRRCDILCERGLTAVPLLIPILNLTVLSRGALPLHASAFTYNGTGVVVTGWAKGGKTEALLAFMARGATYVGDEWVYIGSDGQCMYGIPEPIRVWKWHLDDLPEYYSLLQTGDRLRLGWLQRLINVLDRTFAKRLSRTPPGRLINRVTPILKRQLYVQLPPHEVFGPAACILKGRLDKLIFIGSHETADTTITPITPQEIARRMVFSFEEERKDFYSYYLKFRFAFPEAVNELIEQAEARQLATLERVLAGKEAYAVYHPYPVSIPSLFDVINPLLQPTA